MSEAEGNNPECNEGDVVRLKSGGPAMTVESTGPWPSVRCLWYSTRGILQKGSFKKTTLNWLEPKAQAE